MLILKYTLFYTYFHKSQRASSLIRYPKFQTYLLTWPRFDQSLSGSKSIVYRFHTRRLEALYHRFILRQRLTESGINKFSDNSS